MLISRRLYWRRSRTDRRYFDCAPMYGLGKSEHFLGHALRVNGLRDKVVISTKVARVLKPASRTRNSTVSTGLSGSICCHSTTMITPTMGSCGLSRTATEAWTGFYQHPRP